MRLSQIVWQLAIRRLPQGTILTDKKTPFVAVPNPCGMWAADPFILEKDNKVYIFAELFSLLQWRGKLGYCVYENNKFSKWNIIFDDEHHYSYPNVFENNGEIYMMPETGSVNEIAIYKAVDFPSKWEKQSVVLSGAKMVDSVFISDNTILSYKMFGNFKNHLVLLKKDNNGWNQVANTIDNQEIKRPAGKIFSYGDGLIRPAQDGRNLYGGAIKFFDCGNISNDITSEKEIIDLQPCEIVVKNLNKEFVGTHTYNSSSNFEIVDVQYYKFSLIGLFKRIFIKLSNRRR